MIYTLSKKLLVLSFLALALIATTFTFAKQDSLSLRSFKWWSWATVSSGQVLCIKNAVDKRETSIISSVNAFHTAILSGLNTRKIDLSNARSLPTKEEIKVAVKKARNTFKSTKKLAKEALRKWERSARKTFRTDVKACKVSNLVMEIERENENTTKSVDY